MEEKEVFNILEQILKNPILFDEKFKFLNLTGETRIREDLKLDFLDCWQIGYWLEFKKGVSIIEEIDNLVTIGEYVNCIKSKLEEKYSI
jgi:hypothetical protein